MLRLARDNSRASGRQGFSLIELLIVMGILALLLGILIPVIGKAQAASRSPKKRGRAQETGTESFWYFNLKRTPSPFHPLYSAVESTCVRRKRCRDQW